MKNITLLACCIFVSLFAIAQQPATANQASGARNMNMGHFYGKIVDAKTGKGIPGVTVQLVRAAFNGQMQRFDSTNKPNNAFGLDSTHRFDSSRKFDSTYRPDTAHRFDSSFQRLNNVGTNRDTSNRKFNTSQGRATIVATVISEANGDFSLENMPVFGNFTPYFRGRICRLYATSFFWNKISTWQ